MWGSSFSPRQQPGSLAEGALLHICLHLGLAAHGACCGIACLAAAGHSPLLSLVTAAQCMSGFSCAPSVECPVPAQLLQVTVTGHRAQVTGQPLQGMESPCHAAACTSGSILPDAQRGFHIACKLSLC